MSLFETVYRRTLLTLLDYTPDTSIIIVVNTLMTKQTQALTTLKENLLCAQTSMKNQANSKLIDISFHAGDRVS